MDITQFNQISESSQTTMFDFSATWCQPCKMLNKTIDKIVSERPQLKSRIVKVDVDESPELAQSFNILGVPTLIFMQSGGLLEKTGMLSEREILEKLK